MTINIFWEIFNLETAKIYPRNNTTRRTLFVVIGWHGCPVELTSTVRNVVIDMTFVVYICSHIVSGDGKFPLEKLVPTKKDLKRGTLIVGIGFKSCSVGTRAVVILNVLTIVAWCDQTVHYVYKVKSGIQGFSSLSLKYMASWSNRHVDLSLCLAGLQFICLHSISTLVIMHPPLFKLFTGFLP